MRDDSTAFVRRRTRSNESPLVALTRVLRDAWSAESKGPRGHAPGLRGVFADRIGRRVAPAEWIDCRAQTLTLLLDTWLRLPSAMRSRPVAGWLVDQADPLWADLLSAVIEAIESGGSAIDRRLGPSRRAADAVRAFIEHRGSEAEVAVPESGLGHTYESFVSQYDRVERRRRGVYYTPPPLVRWIVRNTGAVLRREFDRPLAWIDPPSGAGLEQADSASSIPNARSPAPTILDPAAGTGVFLAEVLRAAHGDWTEHASRDRITAVAARARWNAMAVDLAARLRGFEPMLPACAAAQLHIAAVLRGTGFDFRTQLPLTVRCRDALRGPEPYWDYLSEQGGAMSDATVVVVGNPPFSGISENRSSWIDSLLRGSNGLCDAARDSYFHIDGVRIRERKVWLNDDYVKFLRVAQWVVRMVGRGVVGYVTNHGFLDGATFRAMRASLFTAFPRASVVDLHGNAKRRERTAEGDPDASVFGIESGTAICILRRGGETPGVRMERWDLRGSRAHKLESLDRVTLDGLARDTAFRRCAVAGPHFLLSPPSEIPASPPETSWRLPEVMPFSGTAPVTARDHFVVAFTEGELRERMDALRDPNRSDAWLRRTFFHRTRSRLHRRGDTRGWKLDAARVRAAACSDWAEWIQTCLYRPFDRRCVFWADWMIDWPRPALDAQWDIPGNLALLTRRQMLPDREPNFFWSSDRRVLDGVIRSDNRGGESIFPLFVRDDGAIRENFSPGFRDHVARALRCGTPGIDAPSSRDLLAYLYALFFSPSYRGRFADALCRDFAPVVVPDDAESLAARIRTGRDLLDWHIGARHPEGPLPDLHADRARIVVEPGFPRFDDGRIRMSRGAWIGSVDAATWSYRVGAHQVCRKWLADRRGRVLNDDDVWSYRRLIRAIDATIGAVRDAVP